MPRRSEITLWQLQVLLKAAELERQVRLPNSSPPTLSDVASAMRVSRQQIVGALARLEERVSGSLVEELDDGLKIRRADLVRRARKIADEFAQFEREAREDEGRWWLRLDGYWAHLSAFLADAARDLERDNPAVYVELSPQFGETRSVGGAGLARRVEHGEIDLTVAPSDSAVGDGVGKLLTHRSLLLAAVSAEHELASSEPGGELDVDRLLDGDFPLLVSPRGHTTRDLLDSREGRGSRFNVEVTGPEPAALVAFQSGRRVPIVASDSIFPPHIAGDRNVGWAIPSHWPALVSQGKLLGTQYAIFYRTFLPKEQRSEYGSTRFVPENVGDWLDRLAREAQSFAAERLGPRTAEWSHLDLLV